MSTTTKAAATNRHPTTGSAISNNPPIPATPKLANRAVNTDGIRMIAGKRPFASYVLLAEDNGSRTCVYDRGDLPGTTLDAQHVEMLKQAKRKLEGPLYRIARKVVKVFKLY